MNTRAKPPLYFSLSVPPLSSYLLSLSISFPFLFLSLRNDSLPILSTKIFASSFRSSSLQKMKIAGSILAAAQVGFVARTAYPLCESLSYCLCEFTVQKLRVSLYECDYQLNLRNLSWIDDFNSYVADADLYDFQYCVLFGEQPPKPNWCSG